MQPRIKMGLAVGAVGLFLNICVSAFIGLCGPFASLIAGGVAGYLAASQERLPIKSEGARAGAIAGGISGALMIIGQLIGGLGVLILIQASETPTIFGSAPTFSSEPSVIIPYYVAGIGTGLCFGIFGAVLAAAAGAGAGYLGTPDTPQTISPQDLSI